MASRAGGTTMAGGHVAGQCWAILLVSGGIAAASVFEPVAMLVSQLALPASAILASALLFAAYRRVATSRPELRIPLLLMALGQFSCAIAEVLWVVWVGLLGIDPWPSIADVFYVAFYPLFSLGLVLLPTPRREATERLILIFDLAIATVGAGLIYWIVVAVSGPLDDATSTTEMVLLGSYVLGDLILLVAVLATVIRVQHPLDTRATGWMASGVSALLAADVWYALLEGSTGYETGNRVDVLFMVSYALLAVAAVRIGHRHAAAAGEPALAEVSVSWWRSALPYFWALTGYAAFIASHVMGLVGFGGFAASSGLLVTLFMGRQMVANRDHLKLLERLQVELRERREVECQLREVQQHLESRIAERTQELMSTVAALRLEIDERERAEQVAEQFRTRFDYLVSNGPVVVYSAALNDDFEVTYVSRNATEQLGVSATELVDDPGAWRARIHKDDWPAVKEHRTRLAETGHSVVEIRWQVRGEYRWQRNEARLVPDQSGGHPSIVGYALDISSRKAAEQELHCREQELRESNRQLARAYEELTTLQETIVEQERWRALKVLASGVAHDLNNALAPITGFAELLLNSPVSELSGDKTRRWLEMILTASDDAAGVVRRLRELYRPGRNDPTFGQVWLPDISRQAIDIARPRWCDQAQARGRSIEVAMADNGSPPARGQLEALRDGILNLVLNAADAVLERPSADPSGRIEVRIGEADGACVLEVKDNGLGMSSTVREQCLNPFFTTKGERGTGLGLAILQQVCEQHGGRVEIDSELGHGTTVRLILPAWTGQEPALEEDEACPPRQRLRVLVVDDQPPVRQLFEAYLRFDGHAVESAGDGEAALDRLRTSSYDLLLTDCAMPGMSGEQLAVQARRLHAEMPIIMVTGFADEGLVGSGKRSAVDQLLGKPISADQLRRAIESVLPDGPRQRAEALPKTG